MSIIRWAIQRLIHWAGDRAITELSKGDIETYLNHLQSARFNPTPINMQVRTPRSVWQRALSEYGLLDVNPFIGVNPVRWERRVERPQFLTGDQVRLLLNSIDDSHFKCLVRFYLLTGARRTEALDLTWRDIDTQAGLIYLEQAGSQTKRRR